MKGSFKGWKKISSAKDHSIMRNEAGHELKIAHSSLSPKLRGQLAEIPVHEGEEKGSGPASARKTGHNKGKIMMSKGGQITKREQKESIKNAIQGEPQPTRVQPVLQPGENIRPMQMVPGQVLVAPPAAVDPMAATINQMQQQSMAQNPEAVAKLNAQRQAYFERMNAAPAVVAPIAAPAPVAQPQTYPAMEPVKAYAAGSDGPIGTPEDGGVPVEVIPAPKMRMPSPYELAKGYDIDNPQPDTGPSFITQNIIPGGALPQPPPGMPEAPPAVSAPSQPIAEQAPAPEAAPQPSGQASGLASGLGMDPYGTRTTSDIYGRGIDTEKAGIAAEARALGAQGRAEAKIAEEAAVAKQDLLDRYNIKISELNAQRQSFITQLKDSAIDPNRYLGSMDTGQRIGTAIGLIMGGIGGGMTGQENPAMKMLNMQIDRDIEAQKANVGKIKTLLEFNQQQFGNERDAATMTKVTMNDIAADKLKAAAANSMDPLAKSRALQAAGKLDQTSAAMVGQYTMRKTMLNGMAQGKVEPAKFVEFVIPESARPEARKELKAMQDAVALRDDTLSAFDQIAKLQTVGSRLSSPLQSKRQIEAIEGPVMDRLTKDISGRVTPQTVDLVKGIFSKTFNTPETIAKARKSLDNMLSSGMNYPTLESYQITPDMISRFNSHGKSNIPAAAPVRNKPKK